MFILLLLIITIPAFLSLLNPWYFAMHDDSHVVRLFLLDQAVRQGYLFPRWVDIFGFGFGYPMFNFYPPLVYYIGLLFKSLGFTYIWAIKLVFITGFILAAVGMYIWMRDKIGKLPAVVSSVMYTYFSYHAVNAYVRGALAEFFAMAVLPFVFYSMDLLAEKQNIRRSILFAVTFASLILTHPLIAFPSLIMMGIYAIYSLVTTKNKLKYTLHTALGGLLGLATSSFFWLPAMLERKFTLVSIISINELFDFNRHFIYPSQLWYSAWGYGGSTAGPVDGMSFQLGKVHIALAALSLVLFVFLSVKKKLDTKYVTRYTLYVFFLLLSLFFATDYSRLIWVNVPFLQYLQFPWRFYTFIGLFISALSGFAMYSAFRLVKQKNWVQWAVVLGISAFMIFQYQKYFKPSSYVMKTDAELTAYEQIAWNTSSSTFDFIPNGVPLKKLQFGNSVVDINQNDIPYSIYDIRDKKAIVKIVKNNFDNKSFYIEASRPFTFTLNTFNFPGWTAYIDGGRLPISDNNKYKLITVEVPSGVHNLEFRFEDTSIRKRSNIASFVGLTVIVLLLGTGQFKRRKRSA